MSLAHANLYDFFDERLADAVDAQGVELSTDSRRYLALLLVERKRSERLLTATDRPDTLAELHLAAATADRVRAMRLYRHLGDRALYVAGYFQESLKRKAVGVDYYADMGIDEEFYWFTLDAASSDGIHWMTQDELSSYGLTNTEPESR